MKLGVFDRRCLTKLSIWEKSEIFLMILPLFFEHFIRVCVFRSFSFFFFVPFLFQCLTNLLFSSSSPRSFHICYFAYLWASKLCAMRPCMWVCTHIAHSFWFFFACLSVLLKEVWFFFWLLQPKFHKEANSKIYW